MIATVFSFFASNSKIFGIATVALGVALLTLGIYSGVKIGSLHVSIATQKSEHVQAIKDLKTEHKEAIKELEEKLGELQKEKEDLSDKLAQRNADIQTQNALIEQNRVDLVAKEKALKEAMAKKPKIVTDIKYVPTGDDECVDLKALIDEYILTRGTQQ